LLLLVIFISCHAFTSISSPRTTNQQQSPTTANGTILLFVSEKTSEAPLAYAQLPAPFAIEQLYASATARKEMADMAGCRCRLAVTPLRLRQP